MDKIKEANDQLKIQPRSKITVKEAYKTPNETSGLYPFMAMAASNQYTLCDLYDTVMERNIDNILSAN